MAVSLMTTTHLPREDRQTDALECIKRHLPTLRHAYQQFGSRQMRLMLKEFERLVQEHEMPQRTT
jgi:hypothetical protein